MEQMDEIILEWEGPLTLGEALNRNDGGKCENGWAGEDCGIYQIYGPHILAGKKALLYIGQTADQTFGQRLRQHKKDLLLDEPLKELAIYLGRLKDREHYTEKDNWTIWYRDVTIAESILIYKYSPHYNSSGLTDYPKIRPYTNVILKHEYDRGRLKAQDLARQIMVENECHKMIVS